MIIYYDKTTGEIVGSAGGRVHQPEELKMWIGSPDKVGRIVVEWKPSAWKKEKDGRKTATAFEPDCDKELKPIFEKIEKTPTLLHDKYKIDVSSGKLRAMTKQELNDNKAKKEEVKQATDKRIQERRKIAKDIFDAKKPIEERFNNLLDLLGLKDETVVQRTPFDIPTEK